MKKICHSAHKEEGSDYKPYYKRLQPRPIDYKNRGGLLSATLKNNKINFFADGELVADNIDASILSDEHIHLGFTGAMVGVNCIDIEKREKMATFKWFKYVKTDNRILPL